MRDVPSFSSAARRNDVPRRRYAGVIVMLALLSLGGLATPPARADEQASLANLLLLEQMADVATTQQLLHSGDCATSPQTLAHGFAAARPGARVHCVLGSEADPLARPFVGSALTNAAVALGLNGLLRFSVRGLGSSGTRALRYSVEIYPAVLIGNVSSIFHIERVSTSINLSVRRL